MNIFRGLLAHVRRIIERPVSLCADISVWADRRSIPVLRLHQPVLSEFASELFSDADLEHWLETNRQDLKRPQVMTCIPDACILGTSGFVKLPDQSICVQGNPNPRYILDHPEARTHPFTPRKRLAGDWFSLRGLWSGNYYHWTHDHLVTLLQALPLLPLSARLLLPHPILPFQQETLAGLGLSPVRLFTGPERGIIKVEKLWFATPLGHTGLPAPSSIKILRRGLATLARPEAGRFTPRRLYISRRRASARRIVNEDDFQPVLEKYGFTTIALESFSVAQQIHLFRNAEAVLAPHGAGLANLAFCKPGAWIGEITAPHLPPCYRLLALHNHLNHHRLFLEQQPAATSDWSLSPQILDKWLLINF